MPSRARKYTSLRWWRGRGLEPGNVVPLSQGSRCDGPWCVRVVASEGQRSGVRCPLIPRSGHPVLTQGARLPASLGAASARRPAASRVERMGFGSKDGPRRRAWCSPAPTCRAELAPLGLSLRTERRAAESPRGDCHKLRSTTRLRSERQLLAAQHETHSGLSIQTPAFKESASRGAAPCRPATPPKKLDTRMRQSIGREKRKKWAAVHQSREAAKEGRRSINPEKKQKGRRMRSGALASSSQAKRVRTCSSRPARWCGPTRCTPAGGPCCRRRCGTGCW